MFQVEEDLGPEGIKVYYVDFGNEGIIPSSQIRSMPDCPVVRTEALAINAKLEGIFAKNDENGRFPKPYNEAFSVSHFH